MICTFQIGDYWPAPLVPRFSERPGGITPYITLRGVSRAIKTATDIDTPNPEISLMSVPLLTMRGGDSTTSPFVVVPFMLATSRRETAPCASGGILLLTVMNIPHRHKIRPEIFVLRIN